MTAPTIQNHAAAALAAVQSAEEVNEQFTAEGRAKAAELSARVQAIAGAKVDAVADTRAFTMQRTEGLPEGDKVPEQWRVTLLAPGGLRMTLTDTAHDQMAQRLSIPKDFYRRLLRSHPDLVAHNVSELLHREPDTRLFRMLKPIAGDDATNAVFDATGTSLRLRAVLGKAFRPIDDAELVATVLPVMEQHGAFLREFSLDDRRLHAKFLTVQQSVQQIRQRVALTHGVDPNALVAGIGRVTINGQAIAWQDEVVRAGAYLRNSETGFASLSVSAVWEILKCLNGMIQAAETRQRHVGGRRAGAEGLDELAYLSTDAQLLDNAATMAKVRDALVSALDERKQVANGNLLLAAKAEGVTRPEGQPLFQFVGNLANAVGLTEGETDTMKAEAMHAVQVEGSETRFAYVQALTATARQMADYDRRTEYERMGWTLLQDDSAALLKLAAEGAAKVKRGSPANN